MELRRTTSYSLVAGEYKSTHDDFNFMVLMVKPLCSPNVHFHENG